MKLSSNFQKSIYMYVCVNEFLILCRYWNRLEGYCRELTKRYTEVSVISGPLFLPEKDEKTGKSYVRYEVSSDDKLPCNDNISVGDNRNILCSW